MLGPHACMPQKLRAEEKQGRARLRALRDEIASLEQAGKASALGLPSISSS